MSATYNWSIRPGVPNKYGLNITDTPDDVAPNNACYVALFGNDITGNGSRRYPYKTIFGAVSSGTVGGYVILGSGVYRESPYFPACYYYGDGDVKFDATFSTLYGGAQYNGIDVLSPNSMGYFISSNCNLNIGPNGGFGGSVAFKNVFNLNGYEFLLSPNPTNSLTNGFNTFLNATITASQTTSLYPMANHCIFYNCKIQLYSDARFDYSLFHNCEFRVNPSDSFTPISDLQTFLSFIQTAYPTNNGFKNCVFADPLFNNPSIGDYTLSINSPAKNASYIGSFIGAHSIGTPLKASGTASVTGFDLGSITNLNIDDDSITLVDDTQNAQIDSVVIPNLIQREISKFPSYGINADRNGQYIDSISDLSVSTISAGTVLIHPTSYIVENSSIDYNGHPYQAGDRFTTATASTTFTTNNGGVIREILEAPERHTIMARFSNGDNSPLVNGDSLISGNWYYVSQGPVNYATENKQVGTTFKAVPSFEGFVGGGTVTLAMANESYQHYEPGIQPTTNNVGNTRTGEILRGNGDPNYVRGVLNQVEFPINAKFVQIRYIIKVNNLKP